ncbi:hypothetical protein Ab1vBOLIVR4_gp74 [Agrobacterium phage OLIVR4]|nr:hypothetical protein Ab1vBOLIVR4_gp74 [Agrobacterium phage OLIVR4]
MENMTREERWEAVMCAELGTLWPSEKVLVNEMFANGERDVQVFRDRIKKQRAINLNGGN